jgi:hypothetical protein
LDPAAKDRRKPPSQFEFLADEINRLMMLSVGAGISFVSGETTMKSPLAHFGFWLRCVSNHVLARFNALLDAWAWL